MRPNWNHATFCLRELMKRDFRLALPEVDPQALLDDEQARERYESAVRDAVRNESAWEVLSDAVLGQFSFQELAMTTTDGTRPRSPSMSTVAGLQVMIRLRRRSPWRFHRPRDSTRRSIHRTFIPSCRAIPANSKQFSQSSREPVLSSTVHREQARARRWPTSLPSAWRINQRHPARSLAFVETDTLPAA